MQLKIQQTELCNWLTRNGFQEYKDVFLREEIELTDLVELKDDDLATILNMKLGPRRRFSAALLSDPPARANIGSVHSPTFTGPHSGALSPSPAAVSPPTPLNRSVSNNDKSTTKTEPLNEENTKSQPPKAQQQPKLLLQSHTGTISNVVVPQLSSQLAASTNNVNLVKQQPFLSITQLVTQPVQQTSVQLLAQPHPVLQSPVHQTSQIQPKPLAPYKPNLVLVLEASIKQQGRFTCLCDKPLVKPNRFNQICDTSCVKKSTCLSYPTVIMLILDDGWFDTLCFSKKCTDSNKCGRGHPSEAAVSQFGLSVSPENDVIACVFCHHTDHVRDFCADPAVKCLTCHVSGHTSCFYDIKNGPDICSRRRDYKVIQNEFTSSRFWVLNKWTSPKLKLKPIPDIVSKPKHTNNDTQ